MPTIYIKTTLITIDNRYHLHFRLLLCDTAHIHQEWHKKHGTLGDKCDDFSDR